MMPGMGTHQHYGMRSPGPGGGRIRHPPRPGKPRLRENRLRPSGLRGVSFVKALEKFGYPAAKVRPAAGPSIAGIDDLLAGIVAEANRFAIERGIVAGMSGREALERL